MNKKIIAASVLLLGVAILTGCDQKKTSQNIPAVPTSETQQATQAEVNQQPNASVQTNGDIKKEIESVAYDSVNIKTKGVWDKKIEIGAVDESQKAVKGYWWAKDKWDWIAWQKDDGKWTVLVSLDGFNCKELNSVPSQYNDFFKDVTYMFGKKNCY